MNRTFKAFRVEETSGGDYRHAIQDRNIEDLPSDGVLVRVQYSSLNYKDALSATIHKGITRTYPHTPGIDAAGTIAEPGGSEFREGDPVIVTSYDLGMNTPGGFGQYIRVPADWIVPLPDGLTLRESMIFGTAGFTAGLSLFRLQQVGASSDDFSRLAVTGATGGVGSLATLLAASNGYDVTAVTGKSERDDWLTSLGAREIVGRDRISDWPDKPLLSRQWEAGIDTVGGPLLAGLIKSMHLDGVVTCCGNVAGDRLEVSVYPFILRGISLLGVDSGNCPMPRRLEIWQKLSQDWKPDPALLERVVEEQPLDTLPDYIDKMLDGEITGRILVNLE